MALIRCKELRHTVNITMYCFLIWGAILNTHSKQRIQWYKLDMTKKQTTINHGKLEYLYGEQC